jgi:predicted ATPase
LLPHVLGLLAEVLADAHRVEEGLTVLAEALETVRSGGRYYHSELCRLKGILLLMQSEVYAMEAEGCFQQALETARQQSARALELRAAVSLGRLYQKQGKNEEARGILTPIYSGFNEGLETADLTEAKAFLEEISSR